MEVSKEIRTRIKEKLSKIDSAKDIYELFKVLNYPEDVVFDITAKRKKDSFEFRSDDEQKIKEIYSVLSLENKLHIFLLETTSIAKSFIRSVTATFDRQYLNFLLILTVDYSEIVFIFPNREKINGDQHKLKLIKLIVNRDEIYYTDVQTLSTLFYEEGTNRRQVWRQWRSAFSVERVTKNFFDDYKKVFFLLKKELSTQRIPKKKSHEFTLQLLNRVMFVYFISKKEGWLNTKRFMKWLWESYKKQEKYGDDEFYEIWLKQVFFKAFNNRSNDIKMLPNEVKKEISNFPFLNGGLFTPNDLDGLEIEISDELYGKIFKFYEKYNFTIKEDMPLEEEVAVDPQMIGYVYESLANVAEEIYDRHDLGIFYTPRVEVDFMARRALIEYLSKNLEDIPKEKLYHLVFDPLEDKKMITRDFDDKFWHRFEEILDNLSAVDPACGSGAFLVGLMNVLTELYKLTFQYLNRQYTDFELKKRIIQYSLYGVDIMPWAIHAAELRLWLQLMVETELKREELRQFPLLPNLDLNLRIGDSLVQEIGGFYFNLRTSDLESSLKKKLSNLKNEKRNYFDNLPRAKYKSPEQVKEEELRLFEEIIEFRLKSLRDEIIKLKTRIKREKSQKDLLGKKIFDKKKIEKIESKIKSKKIAVQELIDLKKVIDEPEKKPFIWDIDFAEIFGDKNGFDIVIGNPPYIRQELIASPNKLQSEITTEDKRLYKQKLISSVKNQFSVIKKINKKSDYYIYFYFHGLSLLNRKGTFCFITSNTWLDVDFGKDLQEFLLKYVPIYAIYDNPKRTFKHAGINTIIVILGAPVIEIKRIAGLTIIQGKLGSNLKYTAKFIMFKNSYEIVINSKNLIEIETIKASIKGKKITDLVKDVIQNQDYRVFPISQEDLLEDGWKYPENYKIEDGRFKKGSYEGNKWGGKFLRAPDIFFTILKKGQGIFTTLGENAEIKRGFTTGVNDFFYLSESEINARGIEEEFLYPVVKSPRETKSIVIPLKDLEKKVFICHKTKEQLKGKKALEYINWGETQETKKGVKWNKVPTVSRRNLWYELSENSEFDLIIPRTFNEIYMCYYGGFCFSDRFYGIKVENKEILACFLSSSIFAFFSECLAKQGLGFGALDLNIIEFNKIPVVLELKKTFENPLKNRIVSSIFEELSIDKTKPIREQDPNPIPDRKAIDDMFFNALSLNIDEIKEMYWSLCEMINNRIQKAKSLSN